jgi:hypothetical protein
MSDPPSMELEVFDARYRWVILQEMRRFGDVQELREARASIYEIVRNLIVESLTEKKLVPTEQDLAMIKLLAKKFAGAILASLSEIEREGPSSAHD